MFGIGLPELIVIMAVALIVVGPDKLPGLARSVAKTLMDLKQTAEEFKDSFNEQDNPLSDIKPELEDAAKRFKETVIDNQSDVWIDESTAKQQKKNLHTYMDEQPDDSNNTIQQNSSEDKDVTLKEESDTPEEISGSKASENHPETESSVKNEVDPQEQKKSTDA